MGCIVPGRVYSKKGFALAEIVVALFFVTMAIVLVGGLAQQVIQFSKRSSQTGAILELRNMGNALTRNTEDWLTHMRSSMYTNGVYAGCLPDPKVNIGTFDCPTTSTSYLNNSDLKDISDNGTYHIASAPIVNSNGELIAGSENDPLYYSQEGRKCNEQDTAKCALKATGYFLRSNASLDQDPGSVKFVIKVERNSANAASATTPMKPQFITMDIGTSWKDSFTSLGGVCPKDTVKVGYYSNGNPACIAAVNACTGNQLAIGLDADNKTICKELPDCEESGGKVVLNSSGTDLLCSTSSPCGPNKLFLGYFAGNGDPMCSGSDIKCTSGEIQVGTTISGGTVTAECVALEDCTGTNQSLSFNGEKFVCESSKLSLSCGANQVMRGVVNGQADCVERAPASETPTTPAVVSDKCTSADIWDSGWQDMNSWPTNSSGLQTFKFTHNLGTLDTVVFYEFKAPSSGYQYAGYIETPESINNAWHNLAYYREKSDSQIEFVKISSMGSTSAKHIRITMWKKGCGGAGGTSSSKFESAELSFVDFFNDAKITVSHNLGRTPRSVRWVAVNKISERGFEPGDEVSLGADGNIGNSSSSTELGLYWYKDYPYPIIFVCKNNQTHMCMINANDSDYNYYMKGLTRSKWRLKVYAE